MFKTKQIYLYFIFITALISTLGSLYYSEIVGFVPCKLCWFQRIFMYPITFVGLVGFISRDHKVFKYTLPLAITGILISSYHYLLQLGIISEGLNCTVGVPCEGRYVNYFGFITIPLMAWLGFIIIIISSIRLYKKS